jgi:hypothetical protein
MARVSRAAFVLLLVLAAAGCGGTDNGSGGATGAAPPPTTAPVTVTTEADTAQAQAKATGKPEFRLQLTAESPQATAGRPWRYIVRATTADGAPAGGTAKMRVFLNGELVDTLGWFPFQGTLSRTHRWAPLYKGKTGIVLQAEVEGPGGTQRVNYPVTVS